MFCDILNNYYLRNKQICSFVCTLIIRKKYIFAFLNVLYSEAKASLISVYNSLSVYLSVNNARGRAFVGLSREHMCIVYNKNVVICSIQRDMVIGYLKLSNTFWGNISAAQNLLSNEIGCIFIRSPSGNGYDDFCKTF